MDHKSHLKLPNVLVFMKGYRYKYRLQAPQRWMTYGFMRFSYPTVDFAHFFILVCIQDELNINEITPD